MQHVAVETGGDLLFAGAVKAAAHGIFSLFFSESRNVAGVDLDVWHFCEFLDFGDLRLRQWRKVFEINDVFYYLIGVGFHSANAREAVTKPTSCLT